MSRTSLILNDAIILLPLDVSRFKMLPPANRDRLARHSDNSSHAVRADSERDHSRRALRDLALASQRPIALTTSVPSRSRTWREGQNNSEGCDRHQRACLDSAIVLAGEWHSKWNEIDCVCIRCCPFFFFLRENSAC